MSTTAAPLTNLVNSAGDKLKEVTDKLDREVWRNKYFKIVFSIVIVLMFILLVWLAVAYQRCDSNLAAAHSTNSKTDKAGEFVTDAGHGIKKGVTTFWEYLFPSQKPIVVVVTPQQVAAAAPAPESLQIARGVDHFSQAAAYPGAPSAESFLSNGALEARLTPMDYGGGKENLWNPEASSGNEHFEGGREVSTDPYAQNNIYQANSMGITSTSPGAIYAGMSNTKYASTSHSF